MNDGLREAFGEPWRRGILRHGPAGAAIVVKFGGSLLARVDWPELLRSLVDAGRGIPLSVVVGGGATVDSIRRIDAALGLDPAVSHGLAIEALGGTARLVAERTGWPLSIDVPSPAAACVVDVPSWLGRNGRLSRIPVGWHVTSDSIAAVLAAETGSDLWLAKSVPPPAAESGGDRSLEHAASTGWVDDWFPVAAEGVARIAWASPVSPTTSRRPADWPASPAGASRRRDSRPSSRRPPRAG